MPDITASPDERYTFPEGALVTPPDLIALQTNIDTSMGNLLRALGGPNFIPIADGDSVPIAIAPTGGLSITVGGVGQKVIAQGVHVDVCPSHTFIVSAPGASDRVDLIAISATRVAGSTSITRNIRPDGTPNGLFFSTLTLVAGTGSLLFPVGEYSVSPVTVATPIHGISQGTLDVVATPTGVTVYSSDPADARSVFIFADGSSNAASGVPTVINLLESTANYAYVVGTSLTAPAPPAGYDAFATVYVHALETVVSPSDITVLFPTLVSPISQFVCKTLAVSGTLSVLGAATLAGVLNVSAPINTIGNFAINSGGGMSAQNAITAAAASPASGKLAIGGTTHAPLYSTLTTDNSTTTALDGPTSTTGSPYNFTIGMNTASFNSLILGLAGAAGTLSAAGYQIGGSTFGAAATVNGALSVAGSTVLNALQASSLVVTAAASVATTLSVGGLLTCANITASGGVAVAQSVTIGTTLAVTGTTTMSAKLQINADLGVTGNTFLGNTTVTGSLNATVNISASGTISAATLTGYIGGNVLSADGSITIVASGANTNFQVTNHPVAGSSSTDAGGTAVLIQTVNQVLSATATVGQNTLSTSTISIYVDQQVSNFGQGKVRFFTINSATGARAGGIGFYYTILTNNSPHL